MIAIKIGRIDGGPRLVIDEADRLAHDFFTKDGSSTGTDPYDAWVGRTDPDRITDEDLSAINRTMRARSPRSAWTDFMTPPDESLSWLRSIPVGLDLFADDTDWERDGCDALVAGAFTAIVGPYRNLAVVTKVLHLKRPALFPILDRLVIEQIGAIGQPVMTLMRHVRAEGRANEVALSSIRAHLRVHGIDRTPVRILDALLWTTHPASSLARDLPDWSHRFVPADSAGGG